MRVYLGSDHAGFELKAHLASHLAATGHEVVDVGPHAYDPDDDYPAFCTATGERVVADPGSLGVVIGGARHRGQIAAHKGAGGGAAPAPDTATPPPAPRRHHTHVGARGGGPPPPGAG